MMINFSDVLRWIFLAFVLLLQGCSGGSSGGTTQTNTAPSAPGILTLTAADKNVSISWSAVNGATSYNLYWSQTSGVSKATGTKITSVSSPYTHASLTNGSTYYYVLTAVNATGESAVSTEASASPAPPAPGWTAATAISTPQDFLYTDIYPWGVKVNDSGAAISAWVEQTKSSGETAVYVNLLQAGLWNLPLKSGGVNSNEPSVAIHSSGDAMIAFRQDVKDTGGNYLGTSVFNRRYSKLNDTWTAAEQISVSTVGGQDANGPAIAYDVDGNAMALWIEQSQVYARKFSASMNAWDATAIQLSSSPRSVSSPKLVVDANNIFTAIWGEDSDSSGSSTNKPTLMARRYVSGSWGASSQRVGWAKTDLPYGAYDAAGRYEVDVNSTGDVVVVWEQTRTQVDASVQESIDTNVFDVSTGNWSTPTTIASNTAHLTWPHVALDNSGNAWAVWTKFDTNSSLVSSVRGAKYTKSTKTWSTPELIDETGANSVESVVMGVDGAGNLEVVWWEGTSPFPSLMSRHYDQSGNTGWATVKSLTPVSTLMKFDMNSSGFAVMIGHFYKADPYLSTYNIEAWILNP